jgi:hypothetical protein
MSNLLRIGDSAIAIDDRRGIWIYARDAATLATLTGDGDLVEDCKERGHDGPAMLDPDGHWWLSEKDWNELRDDLLQNLEVRREGED